VAREPLLHPGDERPRVLGVGELVDEGLDVVARAVDDRGEVVVGRAPPCRTTVDLWRGWRGPGMSVAEIASVTGIAKPLIDNATRAGIQNGELLVAAARASRRR
jgi:hypothetical protein